MNAPRRRSHGPGSGPEGRWQHVVTNIATRYGWEWWKAPDVDPRLTPVGYKPGWPDLVLAKSGRVLFVELKGPGKYPTPDQRKWLALLYAADLEVGVWWPKDVDVVLATLGPAAAPLELPARYRTAA